MRFFRESLSGIVSDVRGIDLRAYEIADIQQIVGELKPRTLELVERSRGVLDAVMEHCDEKRARDRDEEIPKLTEGMADLCFERRIDATVAAGLGSTETVSEITFVAELELRQRSARVQRIDSSESKLAALGECDSCLRRIRKALSAVENAIAEAQSVTPLLDFTSELQSSLAVRSAYAKWTARLLADGDPEPAGLQSRLRCAGTLLAVLVGWEVYPELRVRDRLLLRELQCRLLVWLRKGDAADATEGIRLWQDLVSCVSMFALVNCRQELVVHDQRVVQDVLRALREPRAASDPAVLEQLHSLRGRDAELDALLAQEAPPSCAELEAVLERIAAGLCCGSGVGSVSW